jgi:hypothetical protein
VRWLIVFASVVVLAGLSLVAAGVGLWSLPAGLVTGGAELVCAGYVVAFFAARGPKQQGRR